MLKRFLISVVLVVATAIPAVCQKSIAAIETEIQRLQKIADQQPADDNYWSDVKGQILAYLSRAGEASHSGKLLYAAESIGRARTLLDAYLGTKQDPATPEAFDSRWKTASTRLIALDEQSRTRDWSASPSAIRALAESAQGQSLTLMTASRAYASVTDPRAGYFYLAQAQANSDFASYCHSLKIPRRGAAPSFRSIQPELAQLQRNTNDLFQPPRSIEKHKDFILLNATLKLAGELDAAKLYAGALYQYLLALQQLSLIKQSNPLQLEQLRGLLASARSKIENSTHDDSIAELYLQKAEMQLAGANNAAPSEEKLRTATVLLTDVLPAYYSIQSAAPAKERGAPANVTVTLVRWPYT